MVDEDLRALEREAEHDPTAARRLALTRFRLFGDCRSGLCGFGEADPGNESVNNRRPRRTQVCPTCRIDLHKGLARSVVRKIAKSYSKALKADLLEWVDSGKPWEATTDFVAEEPTTRDRIWLMVVVGLEEESVAAWVDNEDLRLRFDARPESAVPERIRLRGRLRSDGATAWIVPTMDNEAWSNDFKRRNH